MAISEERVSQDPVLLHKHCLQIEGPCIRENQDCVACAKFTPTSLGMLLTNEIVAQLSARGVESAARTGARLTLVAAARLIARQQFPNWEPLPLDLFGTDESGPFTLAHVGQGSGSHVVIRRGVESLIVDMTTAVQLVR